MKEIRSARRVSASDILKITTTSVPSMQIVCFSKDASASGLSFSAHFAVKAGDEIGLTVTFSSPSFTVGGLVGRVAWVKRVPHSALRVAGVDLSGSPADALKEWREALARRHESGL